MRRPAAGRFSGSRRAFAPLGLFLLLASRTIAAPGGDSIEAAKAKARSLIARASEAFERGRYPESAACYLEAYDTLEASALHPKPELLYNAGLAFENIGECDRVVELFGRFLKAQPSGSSEDLLARLERARECAPEVVIQTEPSGAEVTIDGQPRGVSPLTVNLRAGGHTIVAVRSEYKTYEGAFAVEAGKPLAISRRLEPLVGIGRVALDVPREVRVVIDDVEVARGPYRGIREITEGVHRLRAEAPGCAPEEITIDVPPAGEALSLLVESPCHGRSISGVPPPSSSSEPTTAAGAPTGGSSQPTPPGLLIETAGGEGEGSDSLVWVTASLGGAALAGGVLLGALSERAADRRDEIIRAEPDEDARDGARARRADDDAFALSVASGATLAAAAAFLIVASAIVFFSPSSEDALAGRLDGGSFPVLGADGVGWLETW